MRQVGAVARVLGATLFRRAFARVAPVYFVVLFLGSYLFRRGGMDPRELVEAAAGSAGLRVSMLVTWTVLVVPAARQLQRGPEVPYLLSLPVPRWMLGVGLAAILFVLSGPVLVLWAFGGAVVVTAALVAVGLAAVLASPQSPASGALAIATVAAAAYSWPLGAAAVGTAAGVLGVRRLVLRAAPPGAGGSAVTAPESAFHALVRAELLSVWRRDRAVLVRASVTTAAFVVIASLPIRNNGITSQPLASAIALALGGVAATIATFGLAHALVSIDLREGWLLEALGVSHGRRWSTIAVCTGLLVGALGLLFGLALGALTDFGPWFGLRLGVASACWFASVAILTTRPAYAEGRLERDTSGRRLLEVMGIMIATGSAVALWRDRAVACVSMAAAVSATPWLRPPRTRERAGLDEQAATGALD